MSITEKQTELLNAKIPREAIASRTNGRMNLSYLEGWYVIDRANKVFENDGWSLEIINIEKISEEKNRNDNWIIGYMATIRVTALGVQKIDVGYGSGIGKSLFDAHEGAGKEAVTDGLKRCMRHYGSSMGNALYEKAQTNVEDSEPAPSNNGGQNLPNAKQSNGSNSTKTVQSKANKSAYTPEQIKLELGKELGAELTQDNMKDIFNGCNISGFHLINDFKDKKVDIAEIAREILKVGA